VSDLVLVLTPPEPVALVEPDDAIRAMPGRPAAPDADATAALGERAMRAAEAMAQRVLMRSVAALDDLRPLSPQPTGKMRRWMRGGEPAGPDLTTLLGALRRAITAIESDKAGLWAIMGRLAEHCGRRPDLVAWLAVGVQCYRTLDLLRTVDLELIRGIEHATPDVVDTFQAQAAEAIRATVRALETQIARATPAP
jgi:hypothetical protein